MGFVLRNLVYHSKVFAFLAILLYRMLLDFIYWEFISPKYNYVGLIDNFSDESYLISWILLIFFSCMFFRIQKKKTNGSIVISSLILISAVPTTTIVAYFDCGIEFCLLNFLYWFVLCELYLINLPNVKTGIYMKKGRSRIIMLCLFFLFAINILFISIFYTGFHLNLNLYEVYSQREAYRMLNIPTVNAYLFTAGTVVFPLTLGYAISNGNKILGFMATFCQLMSFATDGRKSTLFLLVAVVLGYKLFKMLNGMLLPYYCLMMLCVGILETKIFNTIFLIELVIRRLLIVPAYLHYAYYDFFSQMPVDFFKQSIMGKLGFESNYDQSIHKIIGDLYYHQGVNANNGLFSDAYFNLGLIGMVLLPFMICIAIKFMDSVTRGLPPGNAISLIIVSTFTFLSSSFFTVMLTHGYVIGCMYTYFIPRGEDV